MTLAVLALLPALALSAAPTSKAAPRNRPRIAVMLVAQTRGAEGAVVRLEGYMTEALAAFPQHTARASDELFGLPADEAAEASLQKAELTYVGARKAFDANELEEADRKLRAALKEFGQASAGMQTCSRYCDAIAMRAAVLHGRGATEEAKAHLIDLMSLHPTFELDRTRFSQELIGLRAQVAKTRSARLRGNLTVKSQPAGARVYLDGELQGHTPLQLQVLTIGKHLVRVERPGFRKFGAVAEVTADESELTAELVASPKYRTYDGQLSQLAGELKRNKGGPAMSALGKLLEVERGLVGVATELKDDAGLELSLGLYDLKSGQRLAGKTAVLQGDEYGQLKAEVARLVNSIVNAEGEKSVKANDPLEVRQGIEDWTAEDKGGQAGANGKRPAGKDPLEGKTGTEEW